jgi:hypothetical protein
MIYENFEKLTDEKHERLLKSVIGLTRAQFDRLTPAFQKAYEVRLEEKRQRGEIKQLPSGGPQGYLDTPAKKLFFILYYLKTYPTFDVLGFHFGLSSGHAHDHVKHLFPVLLNSLSALCPRSPPRHRKHSANLLSNMAILPLTGWNAPASDPRRKNVKRHAIAVKKTPYAERVSHLDPPSPNPLSRLRRRRPCPRLYVDETDLQS